MKVALDNFKKYLKISDWNSIWAATMCIYIWKLSSSQSSYFKTLNLKSFNNNINYNLQINNKFIIITKKERTRRK